MLSLDCCWLVLLLLLLCSCVKAASYLARVGRLAINHLVVRLKGVRVDSSLNLPEQFFLSLSFKRYCASQKCVKHDSTCPDISRCAIVCLIPDDLRAHIRWCTTENPKSLLRYASEAEINYFHHTCLWIIDNILGFYIAMVDVTWMHIG